MRAATLEKCKRVCTTCGAGFMVKRASTEGINCVDCRRAVMAKVNIGRKDSDETKAKRIASIKAAYAANPDRRARQIAAAAAALKAWYADPENAAAAAKRSSDRMKRRHQDPQFQQRRNARSSRVMKANWVKHRDLFIQQASDRYARHLADGTGINSDESKAKKAIASRWILKKANDAMHAETDYDIVFGEVLERMRRQRPYDGPLEHSDYYEYCKIIGTAVTSSPECRAIADPFMSKAIPRFAAEYRQTKQGRG